MNKKSLLALAMVAPLCACVATAPVQLPVSEVNAPFDEALAARLVGKGSNVVKGNAFMRQRGGGVVTCAGQDVRLIPATEYAKSRMFALYNTNQAASNQGRSYRFVPDPPAYYQHMRKVKCDAQGNFVFDAVADGDFFLVVQITWYAGNSLEGGNLMHPVTVNAGSAASVVMSP